jgi:hypothetical protein
VVDLRTRTVHLVTPEAAAAGRQADGRYLAPVRSERAAREPHRSRTRLLLVVPVHVHHPESNDHRKWKSPGGPPVEPKSP